MCSPVFLHVDVIMDMLGSPTMRQIITESYQTSNEPIYIQRAIRRARLVNLDLSVKTFVFTQKDLLLMLLQMEEEKY